MEYVKNEGGDGGGGGSSPSAGQTYRAKGGTTSLLPGLRLFDIFVAKETNKSDKHDAAEGAEDGRQNHGVVVGLRGLQVFYLVMDRVGSFFHTL